MPFSGGKAPPWARLVGIILYIAITFGLAYSLEDILPRAAEIPLTLFESLAFLAFLGSAMILYYQPIPKVAKLILGILVLLLLMPALGLRNGYYLEVATQVGIFAALALGLNIVVGFAGLLDLGYVAFYAVGAYLWAFFGSTQAGLVLTSIKDFFPLGGEWFFLFLCLGVIVGGLAGILLGLPVLRLRGDYLAIVTLGFGEVIRVMVNNLDKPLNLTNGPQGISPIQRPPLFFMPLLQALGFDLEPRQIYPIYFYLLVILIALIVIFFTRRLDDSPIGRAWIAIREDELAAQAMGVPLVRTKLTAFAAGASFAGAMGVLFAAKQIFINPESFTLMQSIGVLAMVILGGMGSIPGVILGAILVTTLNLQILKALSDWLNAMRQAGTVLNLGFIQYAMKNLPVQLEPAKYERMVFGIVLVLMMIFRPEGVLPASRRKLEITANRETPPEAVSATPPVTGGGE
ncbi:MAG: branched-chain amino acid ABC transporter permease [Chloroflexi bacterium]|nr:branched-chain amino acid ABC transporter permease [Chloroflexota bacterium]